MVFRSNSSLNSGESLKNEIGQHSSVDSNDSSSIPSNIIDASTGGFVVFIYGIGPETTQDEVFNIFQGFGPILRTDIIKNKRTTVGKGLDSNLTKYHIFRSNFRLWFCRISTYE
jgi:RNA recognition motif-containing protein